MIRILAVILVASLCDLAEAQDLVITNARILDGRGTIIQAGSIAVEAELIASVSKDASAPGAIEIDARGMTVMPGLIDSHTHLLLKGRRMQSETALSRWISDELPSILADYLAAGVTTVMSHGDFFPEIMEVRRLIDEGELPGPRLLVSGPFLTASNGHPIGMLCDGAPSFCRASLISEIDSPESARAKVRDLGEAGVNAIKIVYDEGFRDDPRPMLSDAVLLAIADEAQQLNLPLIAHAPKTEDALKVIKIGATRMAHPPIYGEIDLADMGQVLRKESIPFATTSHSRAHNNVGAEEQLNQYLGDIRELVESGATIAFGTDGPGSNPTEAVSHEIETISRILSPAEVVAAVTLSAAIYVGLADEIGTLEPGKLADIVVIDGDPLSNVSDLGNVMVVIQRGKIVLDNR